MESHRQFDCKPFKFSNSNMWQSHVDYFSMVLIIMLFMAQVQTLFIVVSMYEISNLEHHNKVQSYCTCNTFAPKTSVGLGMRQILYLCNKLLTLNCMTDGTFRPNWWSEIRLTFEGDNRNQQYKAFHPPSRWPSSSMSSLTMHERELAQPSYTYYLWIHVFTTLRSQ